MAKFLTTHSTASEIDTIIRNAQSWLVLISPYFQVGDIFLERLQDAGSKNVKITLVYGKTELKPEELKKLSNIKNVSLLYYENVHAKCYCNQDNAVITSMNLYEFSEKNNREMGILLQRDADAEAYKETYAEIISIINASVPVPIYQMQNVAPAQAFPVPQAQRSTAQHPIPTTRPDQIQNSAQKPEKSVLSGLGSIFAGAINSLISDGHCIRCNASIDSNIDHPLCRECYKAWNKYKNPEYPEEYCHKCGKRAKTTMLKPLCRACYSKS